VQDVKLIPVRSTECYKEFMAERVYFEKNKTFLENTCSNIDCLKISRKSSRDTSIEASMNYWELVTFNKIDRFFQNVMPATFLLIILYLVINIFWFIIG